jgi:RNA polymerase-binding transcription factor DksA
MGNPARGAVTDGTVRYALEQKLRRERARLWEEATAAESEIEVLAGQRESELEDAALQRQMVGDLSRFDLRSRHEIEEIDAALIRLADGRYGGCQTCGRRIAIARLAVLPATRFCVRCAALPKPPEL